MCGIAGIMLKEESDIGDSMYRMLYEIRHRGSDATGATFYFEEPRDHLIGRISMRNPEEDVPALQNILGVRAEVGDFELSQTNSPYTMARVTLQTEPENVAHIYRDINSLPSLCVHSLSSWMEVHKDAGMVDSLDEYDHIRELKGQHALGHTRLATESIDNINFAHPFSSDLYPELTVVHNGQLTNYFTLRRRMEAKGVVCKTFNDSEIIAHYLAFHIKNEGYTFREAMEASLEAFDGVFSYLAATENEIGAVRDRLGIKPVLYFEDEGILLLGSEQVSFESLDPGIFAFEMVPGEVRTWSRN